MKVNKFSVMAGVIASILSFAIFMSISSCSFEESERDRVRREAERNTIAMQAAQQASMPTPHIPTHFQEANTVNAWAIYWDRPDSVAYVYLFIPGVRESIGYYVTKGKPVSTRSYLTPGYREELRGGNGGVINVELPAQDGTYGEDNVGIRFFTASGIAVEFAGAVSYIYSSNPLPMHGVPLLGQ